MSDGRWAGDARYQALLAVAQAANSRRDLSSVMDAVAGALKDLVAVDFISLVTRQEGELRVLAAHARSTPRSPDESHRAFVERIAALAGVGGAKEVALAREVVEAQRKTLVLNEVQTDPRLRDTIIQHTQAECAVLVPLTMDEEFVGAMMFARMTREPFRADEVAALEDVARPIATGVANALAFEEILRLRSLLEEENLALREEIAASAAAGGIIGASPSLRLVLERVARVAATDSTVLITGETGTGKELIARAIHAGSPRAKRAMVKVNCAALPEGLVASELFGHERGAFTGALERRRGRFELAAGGTIFLDEVGDLPAPVQVALLRVLQEREFERVGGTETLRTDARVVAATNRDLEAAAREGKFRADLLFRLNVFPIHVPALRDRAEDIPLLAEYWVSRYSRQIGKRVRGIEEGAMAALVAYRWPGNVRELQNVIERAVILAHGPLLGLADLELPGLTAEAAGPSVGRGGHDRQQIEQALAASRGRVYGPEGAAEVLGVPPSTLEARIRRLGIDKHAFKRRVTGL